MASIETFKVFYMNGEEYAPGNIIDSLCWRMDNDGTTNELYNVLLRDIADDGIVVWDGRNECDVFVALEDIIEKEYEGDLAEMPFD